MFEVLVLGVLALFATEVGQVSGEDLLLPIAAFLLVLIPLVTLLLIERSKLFSSWRAFTKKRFLAVLLITPLVLLAIPFLGFPLVSSLLVSFYALLLGEKRIFPLMVLLIVWNAVLFGVFVEVLHVPVPEGELFGGGGV